MPRSLPSQLRADVAWLVLVGQPGGGIDVHLLRSILTMRRQGCIRRGWLVAPSGQQGPASQPNSRPTHFGAMSAASVLLMYSSFLQVVSKAPRTLPVTSADQFR
jgi:hypothetical protein